MNLTAMESTDLLSENTTNTENSTLPANTTIPSGEWTNRQIILTLVLGIITIVTILSNSFVLYIFFTGKKKLRTATHLLLANMAVADLIVGILVMPMLASVTILDFKWIWGELLCLSFDYVHFLACATSMLSMIGVSVERYIGVKHPLQHKQIMTKNRVYLLMIAIWILAACMTALPLTFWPKVSSGLQYVCYVNLRTELMYFVIIVVYWIPISLTIVTYYCIYRNATRSLSYSASMSTKKVNFANKLLLSSSTSKVQNTDDNDSFTAARLKQTRLTKSIAMITGVIVLFYAPVFATFTLVAFGSPLFTINLLIISGWIRYCCSTVNPFMYALAIPGYRQEIRERIFGVGKKGKGINGLGQSEITSYATTSDATESPLKANPTNVNVEKPKGKDQYCTQCGNLMRNIVNKLSNACCDNCNRKVLCASWILPTAWGTPCYFMCPECPSIRYFDGTQASFCQNCSHRFQPVEIKHSALQRSTSGKGKHPAQNIYVENLSSADRNLVQITIPKIAVDNKHVNRTAFGEEPRVKSKLQTANSDLLLKLNDVDSGQKAKVVKRLRESVIGPLIERRSRLITNRLTAVQTDIVGEKTTDDVDWIQELDDIVIQLQSTLDILDHQNSHGNDI